MASAKQQRARDAFKAFVKRNGRAPRKGESIYGGRAKAHHSAPSRPSEPPKKRRRKAKPKPFLVKVWRNAKKHPVKALVKTVVGVGAVGLVAHPRTRGAGAAGARRVVAMVRGKP